MKTHRSNPKCLLQVRRPFKFNKYKNNRKYINIPKKTVNIPKKVFIYKKAVNSSDLLYSLRYELFTWFLFFLLMYELAIYFEVINGTFFS